MARRTGVSIHTSTYGKFKGVDFSTDSSLVDDYRSPWAVNMIADTGGMPEKRMGWRTLHQLEGPINGLFYGVINGEPHFLAHGGTKLYRWTAGDEGPSSVTASGRATFPQGKAGDEEPVILKEGLHDGPSAAVNMGGKLWVLTGGDYLVYDGETARDVSEIAYVPTTVIGAAPAGGGEVFEAINMLQPKQKNEFIPDGTSTVYQLSATGLDETAVEVSIRGEAKVEGTDFTVDRAAGRVTFTTAPAKPAVGQEGEVVITFAKTVPGYGDKVKKCAILTTYGVGTSDRLVISGNPDFPNVDYTSGLSDPSYFPDLGYSVVGMESTAIMGYRRIGEYLAIIKADNGQDTTVFLRSAGVSASGEAVFPLKQSIAGVGAVSRRGFGNILDEQLFLAGTGVYAITANVITAERIVQSRSFFVDSRLTSEPGLESAAAVNWNGMYLVAVNGHVYLLDGRQDKTYKAKSQGDYVYECYYWEDVPAVCWMNYRGARRSREQAGKTGAEARAQGGARGPGWVFMGSPAGREARWGEESAGEAPPVAEKASPAKGSGAIGGPNGAGNRKAATRARQGSGVSPARQGGANRADFATTTEALGPVAEGAERDQGARGRGDGGNPQSAPLTAPFEKGASPAGDEKEVLFFGTADGRVCRFNSDVKTMERYNDDGAPIFACWATKADDDGDVTLLKTMIKKGNSVTIKPYTRSSARVCFRTDQDPIERDVAYDMMDIFDWEDIDFTRFTFNANDAPREILFNTKVKKYKRLQIIIKNDVVNEGFGLFGITKHYVVGNFAKR